LIKQTVVAERDGAVKYGHITPGARVYLDHFESRLRGRTYDSFGKLSSATFKGGCIIIDHASPHEHVEQQVGFSAGETIQAKQEFERVCLENGVVAQDYPTDSGEFEANKFMVHIDDTHQKLRCCGTSVHHQNGVKERGIQTIINMASAMILQSSIHWKNS
jgi:hypothetical protein